jgi:hypothetical protein
MNQTYEVTSALSEEDKKTIITYLKMIPKFLIGTGIKIFFAAVFGYLVYEVWYMIWHFPVGALDSLPDFKDKPQIRETLQKMIYDEKVRLATAALMGMGLGKKARIKILGR